VTDLILYRPLVPEEQMYSCAHVEALIKENDNIINWHIRSLGNLSASGPIDVFSLTKIQQFYRERTHLPMSEVLSRPIVDLSLALPHQIQVRMKAADGWTFLSQTQVATAKSGRDFALDDVRLHQPAENGPLQIEFRATYADVCLAGQVKLILLYGCDIIINQFEDCPNGCFELDPLLDVNSCRGELVDISLKPVQNKLGIRTGKLKRRGGS